MVERGLGGDTNAAVVHVWEVHGDGGTAVTPDQELGLPLSPTLQANYPNPFNRATLIPFELSERGPVRLVIYNLLGQPVRHPNRPARIPRQLTWPTGTGWTTGDRR